MAYLDKFNIMVGETIMECQRIEHDVKLIYAGMLKGDFQTNINLVKDEALGTVLIALKELDNSDGSPYFSKEDYRFLKDVKNVRNWLAHQAFVDFMYYTGDAWNENLEKSFQKLTEFHARMQQLGDFVENVRIDVLKEYGRF